MSKFSTKELSEYLKISPSTIRTHLKRGKLKRNKEGFFDLNNEINKNYIASQNVNTILQNEKNKIESNDPAIQSEEMKLIVNLDLRKKTADTQKSEAENQLKKMQLEKLAGRLLPVDLVSQIFNINIQSIFKTFEGELENMASIYNEVFGGSRKELAEILQKQRELLDECIKTSKENVLVEIESAINSYTETKLND